MIVGKKEEILVLNFGQMEVVLLLSLDSKKNLGAGGWSWISSN
jgi:hypothetical protein